MKIIHLLSQVELTGAEVYAIDLTDELIKHGHTCYIVSDRIHKRTKASFVPLTIHNATFFRRLRSILFLRRFIKTNGVHIVHAHSRAAVRIGFWATRFSACALISTLHGKQHYSYSKRLFNIYGENILSVCENIKKHFVQQFGFPESKVQIARNFLNTEFIDSVAQKSNLHALSSQVSLPVSLSKSLPISLPNQLSLTNDEQTPLLTISFLGRTSGPKGLNWAHIINTYIETWLFQFPNVVFQFGGGELSYFSEATQQKIKRLMTSHPDRFKFLGKLDQLFETISSSNLIFGSGRIAIESLYLKKPVIAIGEEIYLGLVSNEKFYQFTESNFGDIDSEVKYTVNYEKLRHDLEQIMQQPNILEQDDRDSLKDKTTRYFNRSFEVSQIQDLYEWAVFKRKVKKNIPILMYHQIVEPGFSSPHKIYVTESRFDEHMAFLKSSGFQSLTFKDLLAYKSDLLTKPSTNRSFPKRPVIISFDDGYENNLTKAVPILKKNGLKAVFYLLTNPHRHNYWDAESNAPQLNLLSSDQRQKLATEMEIGSHGFDHKKLSTMDYEQATQEFEKSKEWLEKEFNTSILSYAYTYGDRSDRDILLARKAGYTFAVNTTRGVFHFADNPHNLFRISIFPTDTIADLKRKTRPWYRRYYYMKRKE
ncbi:MAG: polysaccharide deacetylase family protein [Bdellovibrionaceae bacterium]|nr:polysaccharide deacetylase family protein [Pseudobdellovibrionaceae bacterium]